MLTPRIMNRRHLLRTGLAATAALAVPPRLFAQVGGLTARDENLLEVARRELQRAGNLVWHGDIVAIADFGVHSSQDRLHFVDMLAGRVDSYLVAHGDGSDPEHDGWLKRYSNQDGSHCTSKGAYMTRSWYRGKYGTSIRLEGLDPTNSNALERAIVMHPASYAKVAVVEAFGKLGRSNGCFAMDPTQFRVALTRLAGGRLLYADSLGLAGPPPIQLPPVETGNGDLPRQMPMDGVTDRLPVTR